MKEEREQLLDQILEANRSLYHQHLQIGGSREWAGVDLTMPQLKMLFTVAASNQMTMTQLARTVGMTLSTATGVADRLIAEELIQRQSSPYDRRVVLIRATEAGIALVDRLTQVGRAHFELIAKHLSIEELRLVARALEAIQNALLEISKEEAAAGQEQVAGCIDARRDSL